MIFMAVTIIMILLLFEEFGIHNVKVFSDPVDELCSLFVIFNFII